MRFAPVALVLVVGAGVVLWFGNTLNSWVLGGLIGGLAALLISIPISLTLFFHFSQRHEEQLRTQEELALAQAQAYQEYEEEAVEVYEANNYMLPEQQRWYEEERALNQHASTGHYLPAPAAPRLPAPGQSARRSEAGQLGTGKMASTRQSLPNEQTYYPGFPGYQERSFRSKHQTAALRAAMDEAAQQDGRTGKTAAYPTRKSSSARPTVPFEQADRTGESRSTRNLARQNPNQQYRSRRAVEGTSLPPAGAPRRSLPAAGESSANRSPRRHEPDTEQLRGRYPQTGPMNAQSSQQQQTGQLRQQQTGSMKQQTGQLRQQQTGQLTRNPRIEEQPRNPDAMTGNLRNPMIRRAPYMYEDDPLREELAQMVEPPSVRRSSRRDAQQYYEE